MKNQSSLTKTLLALQLVILSASSTLVAQTNALDQAVTDFAEDSKSIVTAPLKWQKKDRIIAFSFVTLTSVALASDEESQKFFVRNRTDFSDRTADFFRPLGGKVPLWALGGLYATGLVIRDPKAKETAYLGLRSILITQEIVAGLKYSFGRARPFADKGAYYFESFDYSSDFSLSLPSGHAATAFAFASVIAHQYPQWWIKYPVYLLASGAAWSRTNDNVHFLSDVIIGGGIGYWVGEKIVHRHQRQKLDHSR